LKRLPTAKEADRGSSKRTATERACGPPDRDKIALVGNPNVGKSVIFGALTGRYVTVSNYPGTTVEIARGCAKMDGRRVEVIDTPGAAGLVPMSEDEQVTRNILLSGEVGRIIQVADSKNVERSVSLSLQIAETGLPFVIALNMTDEAKSRGIDVNSKLLGEILGVDAVPTVATRRQGIDKLAKAVRTARKSPLAVAYDPAIEDAIKRIEPMLGGHAIAPRSLAAMFLSGDHSIAEWARLHLSGQDLALIHKIQDELQSRYKEPLGYVMAKARWTSAASIAGRTMRYTGMVRPDLASRIGRLMMHNVAGWLMLAAVLWLTYEFVGRFGAGTLVGLLESGLFERHLNPAIISAVNHLLPWHAMAIVRDALAGEYGLLTVALKYAVAIILPIVTTFFIAFGVLEDTGYLPRLAVMTNQALKRIGLNGKAVLPMVLGLGCGTMAALTSRIMETRKERILVILLLALGVPCSAQLGVILGMLHGVGIAGTAIWIGVLVSVMFLVGYVAAKVIPGRSGDFILELPPVRVPQLGNIVMKTLARIEWYLKEAVPLFMLGTLFLFVLHRTGLLHYVEVAASPVVRGWVGLPEKATEAFIVGFLRRDYGAAGLYALQKSGQIDGIGVVVGVVTLTLFIPCIANFFIVIKELGVRSALAMAAFIFPFAFLVGGLVNLALRSLNVTF
jgi:ferrous iron transport protein B